MFATKDPILFRRHLLTHSNGSWRQSEL